MAPKGAKSRSAWTQRTKQFMAALSGLSLTSLKSSRVQLSVWLVCFHLLRSIQPSSVEFSSGRLNSTRLESTPLKLPEVKTWAAGKVNTKLSAQLSLSLTIPRCQMCQSSPKCAVCVAQHSSLWELDVRCVEFVWILSVRLRTSGGKESQKNGGRGKTDWLVGVFSLTHFNFILSRAVCNILRISQRPLTLLSLVQIETTAATTTITTTTTENEDQTKTTFLPI